MSKLSNWMPDEDGIGAMRIVEGTDPYQLENRVAFIEKTPRVRIRNKFAPDWLNWCERPFKGSGPNDPDSRAWCDAMLVLMGHELP